MKHLLLSLCAVAGLALTAAPAEAQYRSYRYNSRPYYGYGYSRPYSYYRNQPYYGGYGNYGYRNYGYRNWSPRSYYGYRPYSRGYYPYSYGYPGSGFGFSTPRFSFWFGG